MFDGLGMGLGFSVALTIIGLVRELLGAGTFFGITLLPESVPPITIFVLAPGAFFVLAMLTALQNKFKAPSATNVDHGREELSCGGDCTRCIGSCGAKNHEAVIAEHRAKVEAEAKRKAEALEAKKRAANQSTTTQETKEVSTNE